MDWLSSPAIFSSRGLIINGHSIVERWEKPVQQVLARSVTPGPGAKILEIGYGLGFATDEIATTNPALHILIEAHPEIANKAKEMASKNTSVMVALWQDIIPLFKGKTFDGIIYDAYPVDDSPYNGSDISTLNYALPFLKEAHLLLKDHGKLSFLDFSCQVHLLKEFQEITKALFSRYEIVSVPLKVPEDCSYSRGGAGNVIVLSK